MSKQRYLVRILCNACKTYHYKTYTKDGLDAVSIECQQEFDGCAKCDNISMCYTIYSASLVREIVT